MSVRIRALASGALVTALVASGSAGATVIGFDDLAAYLTVTTQYPEVTFSSEVGEEMRVLPFGAGAPSVPNAICTAAVGGEFDCARNVYLDFTNPVSNLTFWAIEPNGYGVLATFFLYDGATLLGTQDLIGLGTPSGFVLGNKFVDLSGFGSVTRLEIRGPNGSGTTDFDNGGNGIAWDEFSFDVIPAPSSAWSLLVLGLMSPRRRR